MSGANARIFYRNCVDGAFLLPVEISESDYMQISEGDALEIDVKNNIVKNTTTHTEYKMRPFAPLIAKIIESGGLFKFDLNKWDGNGTDTL